MAPRISKADAHALGLDGLGLRRRNKYNVAKREDRTWRGKCYDSKAEMLYAQLLADDPDVIEVVEQPRVWLGVPENAYRPDFLVIKEHGHPFYVDVKGVETAAFKRNKKLWAKYGRLMLAVVKYGRDGRFTRAEIIHPPTKEGDS